MKMKFPENLAYTKEHEWILVDIDKGIATVGITDYAQSELGDVVYVDLKPVGEVLKDGDVFGTVEAVKTVSDLFMPVSGEIIKHNELRDDISLVNKDPYGDGWLIKIKVDSSSSPRLLSSQDYQALLPS